MLRKIIFVNWRIKTAVSMVSGEDLLVVGKNDQGKLVETTIYSYSEMFDWLKRERDFYINLFENHGGPKSHFRNLADIYAGRLIILEDYIKNEVSEKEYSLLWKL